MFNAAYIAENLLHRGKPKWSVFLQLRKTPLHLAVETGPQRIVELLLDKGVNAEPMDSVWCCVAIFFRLVVFLVWI